MAYFDFNFYSGDVYGGTTSSIIEFLKIIGGAVFGIAITKGVEILGERKRITRTGEDLINEVLLLEEPIKKQIKSINELILLVKEEKTNVPVLTFSLSLNTNRVKDINRNDVSKFFERHYKDRKLSRDKINKIYVSLDVIYFNHEQIKILFNGLIERGTVFLMQCKENVDKMARTVSLYQAEIEKKGKRIEDDKLINDLSLMFNKNFKGNTQVDFLLLQNTFFVPFSKMINDNRTDDRTIALIEFSYNCNEAIKELKYLKDEMVLKFGKVNESLEEQMKNLIEYTKEFNR